MPVEIKTKKKLPYSEEFLSLYNDCDISIQMQVMSLAG